MSIETDIRSQRALPLVAILALTFGVAPPGALAGELITDPYVSGGFRYDTNPRYLSSQRDPDPAWGSIVDARLPMTYRTQRASISLDPRLVYSFYPEPQDDDLEDHDKYLIGDASWMFRRANIGAGYGYTNLSLRTSEFQSAGDPSSGGSGEGFLFGQDTQRRLYFQPYWQYLFSETNSFILNADYEEVRYDEDLASRRYDYDYGTVSASFTHAINSRHNLGLRAQWAKFDSENAAIAVQNDSETNSLNLVYEFMWSETTQFSADIGWARTKSSVKRPNSFDPVAGVPICEPLLVPIFPCEIEYDSSNFVGNLTLTKQAKTIDYRLIVGQSITPNSNGAEVLRFNVDAWSRKRFTERFSGQLGLVAFTQSDVGDTERDFQRDYVRATMRLRYRFFRHWSLYGAYAFTWNDQSETLLGDNTYRNNFVSGGIIFESDGWRW